MQDMPLDAPHMKDCFFEVKKIHQEGEVLNSNNVFFYCRDWNTVAFNGEVYVDLSKGPTYTTSAGWYYKGSYKYTIKGKEFKGSINGSL